MKTLIYLSMKNTNNEGDNYVQNEALIMSLKSIVTS